MRQRDLSKDSWGYLLPFVPAVTLAVFGRGFENRPPDQIIAIVVVGVAVFLGVHAWNMYTARKFQHEIEALDAS